MDIVRDAEAFRAEVREFCARELPHDLTRKVLHNEVLGKDDYLTYLAILARKGWSVGLNGYSARQLTDDEIDGEPVAGTGRRLRVDALGPQLIYRGGRWGAIGKWQHESGARNKAEGDKYWVQLFVGL